MYFEFVLKFHLVDKLVVQNKNRGYTWAIGIFSNLINQLIK